MNLYSFYNNKIFLNNNKYNINLVNLVKRMYSNNPNDRPNALEAFNQLSMIEKTYNIKKSVFNSSLQASKNSDVAISSLKCILQCFYGIENMGLIRSIIQNKTQEKRLDINYFPLQFKNMMDIIEKKNNNKVEISVYNDLIKFLRNQLSQRKNLVEGFTPAILYHNILSNFTKDFCSLINWNNMIFSQFKRPSDLPENRFSKIYEGIKEFQTNYISPLVDIFYFNILTILKCPNCNNILDAFIRITSFLPLYYEDRSINDLIKNYLSSKNSKDNFICDYCGTSGNKIIQNYFFNSPKYLVLDLNEKNQVFYDENIDISKYLKTNIGPTSYELYAVINKEKNNRNEIQYIASVKENDQWYFYSGNSREKCGIESLNTGMSSCAIYKHKN